MTKPGVELEPHEQRAWDSLVAFGARKVDLAGTDALDVSAVRITSKKRMAEFVAAFLAVTTSDRSRTVRRGVDRHGRPTFIVRSNAKTQRRA